VSELPREIDTDGDRKDLEVAKSDSFPAVVLDQVVEKWKDLISGISSINSSIGALLKSSKPSAVEGNTVVLNVSYKFHKERMESTSNKKIIEKVLEEVLGQKTAIRCIVTQKEVVNKAGETGELTDLNIRIPQNVIIDNNTSVVKVFDGSLPL